MKKLLKIFAVLIGLFIVACIVAVIVIKKKFPPERIKQIVIQQASEKLHREVKLGEVKIGLFSGIEIHDFAVSELPTFKKGTFIETDNFVLKLQLLPLLSKQFIIEEVSLENPRIQIIQNADGKTFNFSDLTETSTAPAKPAVAPKPGEEEQPLALIVSKAKISKGNVQYKDLSPAKNSASLNPIDLSIQATSFDKPMAINLSVDFNAHFGGKNIKGFLKTDSVVEVPVERIQINSLELKTGPATVSAEGKISNFKKPELDLTASVKEINFKELSQWAALPPELKITGTPEINLDLKGTQENLNVGMNLNLTKSAVAYADLFQKPAETELSANLKAKVIQQKNVRLENLKLKLANMETNISGDITDATGANPNIRLKVSAPAFDVKNVAALSPLAAPYSPAGQVSIDANAQGLLKTLKYSGLLNLMNLSAKVSPYNAEGLNGKVNFTDNSLDVPQLSGKLSAPNKTPADFKIKANVQDFTNPDVTLDANFQTLDLAMFTGDSKAKSGSGNSGGQQGGSPGSKTPAKPMVIKTQGQVTIGKVLYPKFEGQNARASWKLTGVTPTLERINGTAEIQTGQGKITDIPAMKVIAPILKMDPSGLAFTRILGHWNIVQGTAKTDDMQINSPNADFYVKGSLRLPTNMPDMIAIAKLQKGAVGGTLGDLMDKDEQGRPSVTFKFKDSWTPSFDYSQIQKKAVQKATEEIKKKAADVLQNEGKKILDGLFK